MSNCNLPGFKKPWKLVKYWREGGGEGDSKKNHDNVSCQNIISSNYAQV